ncbi:hypothetical protein ABL78_0110 [Leptomonas seymouri]|uniref:Uncharacterized protein n=1 Tax=Leptomonas seymouri TaxID=5684 RepID=A0A0N0P9M1_LEPSE|nr:hypothetical protein ABL78_0110 [Leptomonas seymouri]|eukprot:KPI90877.1 hypothetical protein ABL78_0110 [Leptomonas seymouri]
MRVFDCVDLPFADDAPSSDSASGVRPLALARELVLAELKRNADAMLWREASERSAAEQERNAALYRSFISEVQRRCSGEGVNSFSPISGSARLPRADLSGGPLALVAVAAPPLALRCSDGDGGANMSTSYSKEEGKDLAVGEEHLLLQSSAHMSPLSSMGELSAWTPQQAASQSSLDGVFFEALLSQQLNLSLWMSCGNPEETLRGMLQDVQQVEQAVCDEKSLLEYTNAARFAEQRAYKRRRTELEPQAVKSRAKVASLEKLLNVGANDVSLNASNEAERLRLWLLD